MRGARFKARSVCKITIASGIGKLHTELTHAFSALVIGCNRIPGALPRFATPNPSCSVLTINAAPLALRQIPETFLENDYCVEFIRSPNPDTPHLSPLPASGVRRSRARQ